MGKNKWISKMVMVWLILLMTISGCGRNPSSVISEGATDFAYGKEETDYAFHSTDEVLEKMMDDFSGSFGQPSATPHTDEEAEDKVDKTEDDQVVDKSTDVVKSDDDLKEILHEMLIDTKEVSVFTLDPGYTMDGQKIVDLHDQLLFEDGYDVIGVESFGWGPVGDKYELSIEYEFDVNTLKDMKKEERVLVAQAKKDLQKKLGDSDASEYEIVCAVNDYLCDKVEYPEEDMNAYPNDEGYAPVEHTAYNALKNGSAVCDGYSKAAKLLLNEFGIDCGVEVGTCTNGGGHAWNLVNVDGSWYQMDVTWNDGASEFDAGGRTIYLLVTDEFMKQSRSWEESWYPATPSKPYK